MLLFDGNLVAIKKKGEGYQENLGSSQLGRFKIVLEEAISEHDASPLGKFEKELEEKFGIQDMTPKALEKEYKRVARREIGFDQDGEPVFKLNENDETRLLRFRQFACKYLFLFSGVAIAIASAITAAFLVTRQALKRIAKRFKRDEKSGKVVPSWNLIPSEEKGGGVVPSTLDWLSDNLLAVLGAVLLFLFFYKR